MIYYVCDTILRAPPIRVSWLLLRCRNCGWIKAGARVFVVGAVPESLGARRLSPLRKWDRHGADATVPAVNGCHHHLRVRIITAGTLVWLRSSYVLRYRHR
jgi:hypothetical protein